LRALDDALRENKDAQSVSALSVRFKNAAGKLKKLRELGRVKLEERSFASAATPALKGESEHILTGDQASALAEILDEKNDARAFLLEGVTGSGKTEDSGVSDVQRRDAWMRLLEGKARVCLGARSAVFAPVQNLGLIVIDEEHDGSLKQDDAPRYHARDVALYRAKQLGARVILGARAQRTRARPPQRFTAYRRPS